MIQTIPVKERWQDNKKMKNKKEKIMSMILWLNLIDLMAINLKSRKHRVQKGVEIIICLNSLNNLFIIHISSKINISHRSQCNLDFKVKSRCSPRTNLKCQLAMVTNITNQQIFKLKALANLQNHKHTSWI